MTSLPAELIRLVAGSPSSAPAPGTIAPGSASFESLLKRASAGEFESGRAVEVDPGLDLSREERSLLARAADQAEARGVHRLLVFLGDRALRVDVPTRRVTGASEPAAGEVLADVDGVVRIAPSDETPRAGSPPSGITNASLVRALARGEEKE